MGLTAERDDWFTVAHASAASLHEQPGGGTPENSGDDEPDGRGGNAIVNCGQTEEIGEKDNRTTLHT